MGAAAEVLVICFALQYICTLAIMRCPVRADDGIYSDEPVHPKYVFMSKFFVRYLRFLASFSSLRILSYVHPELLAKNAREFFSTQDDIARAILEKFLKVEPGEESDDRLILKTTSIVLLKHGAEDEQKLTGTTTGYLAMNLSEAVKKLRELDKQGHIDNSLNVNRGALQYVRRLQVYTVIQSLLFGLIVLACCVVGVAAFLVKLCHLAVMLISDTPDTLHVFGSLALFFNGIVGIISVNQLLWWRVEVFVFGGSDAHLSTEERYVLDVYMAVLYEKLWTSTELRGMDKLAALVQLDEDDIQQLIVEEDEGNKAKIMARVGKYIRKFGHAGHCVRSELSTMLIGLN